GSTAVLTHAASHTIRGTGNIYTRINNHGLIEADVADRILQLHYWAKDNAGTIRAVDGGVLAIAGITLTQNGSGRIVAADSSKVILAGPTIDGGLIETIGAGAVDVTGSTTLRNAVVADADMRIK